MDAHFGPCVWPLSVKIDSVNLTLSRRRTQYFQNWRGSGSMQSRWEKSILLKKWNVLKIYFCHEQTIFANFSHLFKKRTLQTNFNLCTPCVALYCILMPGTFCWFCWKASSLTFFNNVVLLNLPSSAAKFRKNFNIFRKFCRKDGNESAGYHSAKVS